MSWLYLIIFLELLLPEFGSGTSSWLRVETGHQNIEIDGRDSYLGYFTRVHFHDVTCVQGLVIHCLKPLTGAEEIEILLSQCTQGNWRVVHYTNSKEEFRLKLPFNARQMMIVSRQPLNVIDVQVQSCHLDNSTLATLNTGCTRDHPSRHGRSGPIRASEYGRRRRFKRDLPTMLSPAKEDSRNEEVIPTRSDIEIFQDKVVEAGKVLRIEEGSRLLFGDGAGLIVYGTLIVNGSKYSPVKFEASGTKWKGILMKSTSALSTLRYVNISRSENGLTVDKGSQISIENVVVDGNDIGVKVQTDSSSIRIAKTYAINNAGPGFIFSGKGTVELDTCISASNKEQGIYVEDGLSLTLTTCNLFSNSKNAISAQNLQSLEIRKSVIDGNGAGIEVQNTEGSEFLLTLSTVNISNHHYGPAIHVKSLKTIMEIENSALFDNYFGVMNLEDNYIQLEIANTNITRNRGKIIYIPLLMAGRIIIGKNIFTSNQFNEYADREAVIEITTGVHRAEDASINIFQNEFTKNIMNDVISVRKITGSPVNTIISDCDFHGNLAQSIIRASGMSATIQYNFLHNVQTSCDIAVPVPSHAEESKNYWGYDNHKEILEHICSNNESYEHLYYNQDINLNPDSSTAFPLPPAMNITTIPWPILGNTYNLIRNEANPYLIKEDIIIKPDETVIIEPGTKLLFAPGSGIIIEEKGKLFLNGTVGNEIIAGVSGTGTWKGISVKPGGMISLTDTTISDAAIGLWIDSDRATLTRAHIQRPTVHGIELTGNSASEHNFGGSTIEEALNSAIVVDERRTDLLISNVSITDPSMSGIDFVSPSANLQLKHINITGGRSHSIHISEYATAPLQSLLIEDVLITNQKRGHSAIFVNSGWIRNLTINRLKAHGNSVPSLVISLDCNAAPSLTTIRNSEFLDNLDTVVLMQLGECGGLNFFRNVFRSNNQNERGGALRIDVQPAESNSIPITVAGNNFFENKGDFTAFLSSENAGIIGKFENNSLEDNSNSVATVVLTSPHYSIHRNRFANPHSAYEIEARGDGSWIADGSDNWWGTSDEEQVKPRLKSFEGSIKIDPIRTGEFHPDIAITHPDAELPLLTTQYEACAHVNYCSYRGTCLAGICVCPVGYIGSDCSVLVGCKNNCSSNGVCGLFNVCACNEGWKSSDCSVPICKTSCGGHGFCVSKDICQCDPGWTGVDCSEAACSPSTCIHGHCNEKEECACDQGYKGKMCTQPICTSCSLNGRCIAPERCECYEDYGGKDCSKCIGTYCNQCDFDCDHGICESTTRTCSCSSGWSGAACDVCSSSCVTEPPTLVYIQPSTSSILELSESLITVFGKYFHKTTNNEYTCVFGTQKTKGLRISSTLMRCPIPTNLTVGRHLFNVESLGVVAQPIDNRPLHFTVYDSCRASQCHGTCYGPLCLCPRGKTGMFCDIIEVMPEIDQLFLTNQVANKAVEGVPYIVYLPSMPGTVLRVNSTIPDLNFDSSRSLLEWADPVGQKNPYTITVFANSLAGESRLAWNLSIEPSYNPYIDNITSEGKTMIVKGHIDNAKLSGMPVIVKLRNGRSYEEEIEVKADENGQFSYSFIPNGVGIYDISVRHPGNSSGDSKIEKINIQNEEESIPRDPYSYGELIGIHDKSCKLKFLKDSKNFISEAEVGNGKIVKVELKDNSVDEEVVLLNCDHNQNEFFIIKKKEPVHDPEIEISPNQLIIKQNISNPRSHIIQLSIRTNGIQLLGPIQITSSTNRIVVLTTNISPDKFSDYSNGKSDLLISFQMDISTVHNGTISIISKRKELKSLSYSIVPENSDLFRGENFKMSICLYDELRSLRNKLDSTNSLASLSITNLQTKKDLTESSSITINGNQAEFWIPEGMYQITAQSEMHRKLDEFIWLSPHNSSICLELKSLSPLVPTQTEDGNWHITEINKQINSFPYITFQPNSINSTVKAIFATVNGLGNGILSPRIATNKFLKLVPRVRSVAVNESFWIQLEHQQRRNPNPVKCDAYLIDVPYDFLPEASDGIIRLSSPLLIEFISHKSKESLQICDEAGNHVIPSATTTNVLCDCSQGAKANCRAIYRSPASCGSSWNRIADDTVSLQVVSAFLLMISECNDVKLNFTQLYDTLQCVSSLESKCPLSAQQPQRSKRQLPGSVTDMLILQHDVTRFLRQISGVSESFINPLSVFNSLDLQSIRIASLYQDFIQRLQDVFPPFILNSSRETIDLLITAIGDQSEDGNYISSEEESLVNSNRLTSFWNNTVKDWNSGKWSSSEHNGISFASMKQLIASSDRLKSFTRQNGGTDPYSVLHEYLGRLLKTTSNPNTICAKASVMIQPENIFENDVITIDVFVKNERSIPLTQVSISVDIVRDDAFSPQAKLVANGISMNTLSAQGVLAPNSTFVASWTKRIIFANQLTSPAKYQLIIALSFTILGKESKQRLATRTLEVHPIRSLKLVYFLSPTLSSSNLPFSVMTSIMNNGYTDMDSVRVEGTDIQVSNKDNHPLEFHIEGMQINDEKKIPTTAYDVGPIASGSSKTVIMNITSSDSLAYIAKIKHQISANGRTVAADDSSIYKVHAKAGQNGILVSLMEQDQPLFFFRPETGNIVNIIPLQFQKSSIEEATNPTRTIVQGNYKNTESRSFFGYLYGSVPYPKVPSNYELIQIRAQGGNRLRDVHPITWIDGAQEEKKLHFIDSGSLSPGYEQSYDFVFADPAVLSVPRFSQNSYRIQLHRDAWPEVGNDIGRITVENDNQNMEYSLYSPDDSATFSVNPKSGHIFLDSPVLPGSEFCFILKAKNSNGEEAAVPISINTGGTRRDCISFNTYGLTSHVHPELPLVDFPTPFPVFPTSDSYESTELPSSEPPPTNFPTPPTFSTTDPFPSPSDLSVTTETYTSTEVFPEPSIFPTSNLYGDTTTYFPQPSVLPTGETLEDTTTFFPQPSILPTWEIHPDTTTDLVSTALPTSENNLETTTGFSNPLGLLTSTLATDRTTEEITHEQETTTPDKSVYSTHETFPDSTLSPVITTAATTTNYVTTTIEDEVSTQNAFTVSSLSSTLPTTDESQFTKEPVLTSTLQTVPTALTHFPLDLTTQSDFPTPPTDLTPESTSSTRFISLIPWIHFSTGNPLTVSPSTTVPTWTSTEHTTENPIELSTVSGAEYTHLITPDPTPTLMTAEPVITSTEIPIAPTMPLATENPFYANACSKTSSSIYSIICELSKVITNGTKIS